MGAGRWEKEREKVPSGSLIDLFVLRAGYREDHATIFLQQSRVGEDVLSAVQHLKDEEQQ